jgi:hypothetical protein
MAKKSKKTTKRKFKGSVSRNAAKQVRGAQFGHLKLPKGVNVFKEDPGSRVSLDIMPYEVTVNNHPDRDDEYEIAINGSLWYKRPYWLHRSIGSDNQSIVCPSSAGQKCPICEYRAQLLKEGADWSDDSVKALKPSMRNLYVVIPKGNKKYDEVPHVWDISQFLFQDKLNEEIGENEEYEVFPDLEEGLTLRIRFSEESFGSNKFAETSRIDFKKRDKPYDESILEDIPSLDDLLEIPSYKAVEAIFFGGIDPEEVDPEEEEEEEEEKKPTRNRKTPQPEPEEEEEETDDDDDDDDDGYDDDDDDDGYDDDDDDDDDDEAELEEEEEEEEQKGAPPKPPARTRRKKTEEPKKDNKKTGKADPKKNNKKSGKKEEDKKSGKKSCPYGYKFGNDCEEYDECDKCEMWEACMDASEGR